MSPDSNRNGSLEHARFFPQGSFGDESQVDQFWHQFHANRLRTAGESPLFSRDVNEKILLLRFFLSEGIGLVAIVEHSDQGTEFIAKDLKLEHAGSIHESAWSYKEFRRQLRSWEWSGIVNNLEASDFWRMPSPSPPGGLDGFHCVLEARSGDRYHLVDRWSPRRNEFADLCELFVRYWETSVGRRVELQYHLSPPWWRLW